MQCDTRRIPKRKFFEKGEEIRELRGGGGSHDGWHWATMNLRLFFPGVQHSSLIRRKTTDAKKPSLIDAKKALFQGCFGRDTAKSPSEMRDWAQFSLRFPPFPSLHTQRECVLEKGGLRFSPFFIPPPHALTIPQHRMEINLARASA